MMEIEINVEQLPVHILEHIFSFVPKNEHQTLRLVSKTFQDTIDNSVKLLKNRWLIVENALYVDSSTIHHQYQKLMFRNLVFNWMSSYAHKDRIKAIRIMCREKDIVRTADSLQYILLNFNYLKMLHFQRCYANDPLFPSSIKIKLVTSQLSNLETLHVGYFSDHLNNVLEMFSNVKTIRNIIIDGFKILKFPLKVEWKLQKLIIPNIDEDEIDDQNCQQFLKSQQITLEKLIILDFVNYASFVMQNLLNLTHLHINLKYDEEFDDSLLLKNDSKLQRLDIEDFSDANDRVLKTVLNHYSNVKFLSIKTNSIFRETVKPLSFDMKFDQLTHLTLKGLRTIPFLNADLPCIKTLALAAGPYDEAYDFSQVSTKNMMNIEKLSVYLQEVDDVLVLLPKFPQLVELNVDAQEWYPSKNTFISSINDILTTVPRVKCLGINKNNSLRISREEILSQISRKVSLILV